MNNQKIAIGAFVLTGIIVFFVARQVLGLVWDSFRLPVLENNIIAVPDIVSAGLGIATFFLLKQNEKTNTFLLEVIAELAKVTWPARKETVLSGVAVIVMVGIASVILAVFDWVWVSVTQKLLTF